jgi:hypothetical protein
MVAMHRAFAAGTNPNRVGFCWSDAVLIQSCYGSTYFFTQLTKDPINVRIGSVRFRLALPGLEDDMIVGMVADATCLQLILLQCCLVFD